MCQYSLLFYIKLNILLLYVVLVCAFLCVYSKEKRLKAKYDRKVDQLFYALLNSRTTHRIADAIKYQIL